MSGRAKPHFVFLASLMFLLAGSLSCWAEPVIREVRSPAGFLEAAGARWLAAERGRAVSEGCELRTLTGGFLSVEDEKTGAVLTLEERSSVVYQGKDTNGVFRYKVSKGNATFTLKEKMNLDVDTPLVVFAVRGTVFSVNLSLADGTVDLAVREGRVETLDASGTRRTHTPDREPSVRIALGEMKVSPEVRQIYRERLDRLIERERIADDLLAMALGAVPRRDGGDGDASGASGSAASGDDDDDDDGGDDDGGDDDGDDGE